MPLTFILSILEPFPPYSGSAEANHISLAACEYTMTENINLIQKDMETDMDNTRAVITTSRDSVFAPMEIGFGH